jgi:hypothetical protein
MYIHPDQRRAMGDAKINLLEAAGYEWQNTLPGGFWHPATDDSIDYHTVVNSCVSDLAKRIQQPPATP